MAPNTHPLWQATWRTWLGRVDAWMLPGRHFHLKEVLCPNAKKIYYFSDGAASQYKNFKNFSNLLYHEEDFGMCAEWHFFATSHGKNACDGVGRTVKREAAKASLQAAVTGHILTPQDLYNWAQSHIQNVAFFVLGKDLLPMVCKCQDCTRNSQPSLLYPNSHKEAGAEESVRRWGFNGGRCVETSTSPTRDWEQKRPRAWPGASSHFNRLWSRKVSSLHVWWQVVGWPCARPFWGGKWRPGNIPASTRPSQVLQVACQRGCVLGAIAEHPVSAESSHYL